MTTAIDTNVLLDIFLGDPQFGQKSKRALRNSIQIGGVIACEVVWAEVSGQFPTASEATATLQRLGIRFSALSVVAAEKSGEAWRAYRARGGTRQRVIADFLIGAHALEQADRLLTRDSGYFRTYYPSLVLLDPNSD